MGGWVGERAKREEGAGKGGKGILLRVPFGFFFFLWKGGGISRSLYVGFFFGCQVGLKVSFWGKRGFTVHRTRRGFREMGFLGFKRKGGGEGFDFSKEK